MTWNRDENKTALDANLAGAEHGFKVTGDAALDPTSTDYAMFSEDGNRAVAEMVNQVRLIIAGGATEEQAYAKLKELRAVLEADDAEHEAIFYDEEERTFRGYGEINDTMVRETIAYALDPAWQQAYGHSYGG